MIPVPLIGDYSVETLTIPDCTSCTGTVCTASSAKVTWKSTGTPVLEKTLMPGESFTYNGRNDGSSVTVKFVSGQAAAQVCPGKEGMTGPQAVSVFVINIVPPISARQTNIRTASTTPIMPGSDRDSHGCIPSAGYSWCEEKQKCLRTWEEPCTTISESKAPTPTKSGFLLPVLSIGAFAITVLVTRVRRG
jgi:hypothetical protein